MADTWKLLVLEDDPSLRQVLADVLSDEGYEVVAVDNGAAAVERASQESFDLIVTDIRMDGVDGLEALERARGYQPGLSSLVVSGYTTEAETLRALQLNVGGYLKKPFSLGDFLQRVRELLSQRRAQRAQTDSLSRLKQSLWWALQSSGGQESARVALYLARQMGLSSEVRQQIRLAASLSFSEEGPFWPGSAAQDTVGLGPLIPLVNGVRQGEGDLSVQIILAAHALCREQPMPEVEPALLSHLEGLWVDSPQILSAVADHEKELGVTAAARVQRSLLGLALTLEERGELPAAGGAYLRLSRDAEAAPETRLHALVGAARVQWAQNQPDWYEVLKEAERNSRSLGPLEGALQRWPIATLLLRSGHGSAPTYLQSLEKELQDVGHYAAAAKARVAYAQKSPGPGLQESVKLLLAPQNLGEVAQDAEWLVPALLNLAPSSEVRPGPQWCRLLCEFPQLASRWIGEASKASAAHVLSSLEGSPELAPHRLLEAFLADSDPELRRRAAALQARLQGSGPTTFLRFRSYGYFDVYVNGERVPDNRWKTQKFKFVLAYLLSRKGQGVSEDTLIEEFWPDSRGSAKASVYAATTTLRRCLRGGTSSDKDGEFILRDGEQILLDPRLPCWHDVDEFEAACVALTSPTPENWAAARQAAGLLTGPYLQGCYLDWAQRRRNQLDDLAIRLFIGLGQESLQDRPQETLDFAQKGLELDPLSQDCHLLKMNGFLKLNQPERAIKQFNLCQRELQKEMGLEPLTSLYEVFYRAKMALP